MQNSVSLDECDLDRKYFYAFFKALSSIKYKEYFQKVKEDKARMRH